MSADQAQSRAGDASHPQVVSFQAEAGPEKDQATPTRHPNRRRSDPIISDLAKRTGYLGREIIEVVAFVDDLDDRSQAQRSALSQARQNADEVLDANQSISDSLTDMRQATTNVEGLVETSVKVLQHAGQHSTDIVDHVVDITQHMDDVLEALQQVQAGNQSIRDIAKTVHLLAINARIEAARAGVAGT